MSQNQFTKYRLPRAFGNDAGVNPVQYSYESLYFALLATGVRPAEGLALKWGDFDPISEMLRITRTLEYISGKAYFKELKLKRRRTINLHDGTTALLLEHKRVDSLPGKLILHTFTGEPLSTSSVLNRHFKLPGSGGPCDR